MNALLSFLQLLVNADNVNAKNGTVYYAIYVTIYILESTSCKSTIILVQSMILNCV